MKDFFILKLIDKLQFIYKMIGVDYKYVRLILQSKMTMDARKNDSSKDNDNEKNSFYTSLIVYCVLGLFSAFILRLNVDIFLRMTIYFTFIMSAIFMAFISEFSSVLLDIKDKNILITKGIDAKTINVAKITHILIYVCMLSLAICGFGFVVAISYGIKFFILFTLSIILIDMFMIVVTSLLYGVVINIFKGEKLKDMINTLQIVISIVFIVGYQIIGQLVNLNNINIVYQSKIWNIFVPPMWFASNFRFIKYNNVNTIEITMSILSIIIPIICFLIYIKNINKFENNLNKLNDNTYKASKKGKSLYFKISNIICSSKEERAIFNFTCNILSKDRDIKMRIYPSLALSVVLPYMLMFTMYGDLDEGFACMSIYLSILMMIGILVIIKYSTNYKASWIYKIVPLNNKCSILKGTIKAITFKIYLPMMIIFSIGFIAVFKFSIIKHLIIILLSLILSTIIILNIEKEIPFSKEFSTAAMSSNLPKMFLYFGIIIIFAILHSLARISLVFTYSYIVVLLILIFISWNKLLKIDIN